MSIQFLYPSFLWALSLIIIPIIIHLFNFRRYKTVYFSNVRWLENVKKDAKAKKQWKDLLILLLRILIIVFLVLAFAQPNIIFDANKKLDKTTVSVAIIIDNSLSMSGKSKEGLNIEVAKNKAYQISQAYPKTTNFTLLSTNPDASQFHTLNQKKLYHQISNIQLSPFAKTINTVYAMLKDHLQSKAKDSKKDIYIISDFQKKDYQNIEDTSKNIRLFLIPISNNTKQNIVLDTCYFINPFHNLLDQQQLVYRISNKSKKIVADFPVQLFINDSLKAITTVNLPAQKTVTDTFSFYNHTTGIKKGEIRINDFPIRFDNYLYFNYRIKSKTQISIIDDSPDKNNYLSSFLRNDSSFDYQFFNTNKIDLQYVRQSDVLIINKLTKISSGLINIIKTHLDNAHKLILFNNFDEKATNKNQLLKAINIRLNTTDTAIQEIAKINKNADLYKNSFEDLKGNEKYPSIFSKEKIDNRDAEFLVQSKQKNTLVAQFMRSNSQILFFAFPLSDKNEAFFKHPIFIPLIYNFLNRINSYQPIYHISTAAFSHNVLLKEISEAPLKILQNKKAVIPRQRLSNNVCKMFFAADLLAGFYPIQQNEKTIDAIAINDDRKESSTEFYTEKELLTNVEIINSTAVSSSTIQEMIQSQKSIWIYFLLIALAFLLLESLLLRYWKK